MKESRLTRKSAARLREGRVAVCRKCTSTKPLHRLVGWLVERLGPDGPRVDVVGCMGDCPGGKRLVVSLGGEETCLRVDPRRDQRELLEEIRRRFEEE